VLAGQIATQLDSLVLGAMNGVEEHIFMISSERRIRHPAIEVLRAAAPRDGAAPEV
jgi:LysR family transcriptional activator of nhaA